MLYRTKKSFNRVFRFVPNVYKRRKNYHKAFRHIQKTDPASLIMIDRFLYHIGTFSDSPILLKDTILKTYKGINECWYIDITALKTFLESILYDMK